MDICSQYNSPIDSITILNFKSAVLAKNNLYILYNICIFFFTGKTTIQHFTPCCMNYDTAITLLSLVANTELRLCGRFYITKKYILYNQDFEFYS